MKIFLHCTGGLGNQLFQYALGRSLAIRNGGEVVIDPWEVRRGRSRPLVLDKFRIQARLVTPLEYALCRVVESQHLQPLARIMRACAPRRFPGVLRRRWHGFDASVLEIHKSVFIEGWFQSELYFREFGEQMRDELQLREAPSEANQRWLEQINSAEAVCVHVRRGDYLTNASVRERIGVCGLEYYRSAIDYVRQRVSSPVFFVFSDDPDWTRQNLDVPEPRHFISHNCNVADWEDLRLMSACRHFIIANSTFSWWGAWLGERENTIVAAPKQWFLDPNVREEDIVPERWVRIDR